MNILDGTEPDWEAWATVAAFAQAVLTALAVWWAARLQDRSVDRRQAADLRDTQMGAVALMRTAQIHLLALSDALKDRGGEHWLISGRAYNVVDTDFKLLRVFPVHTLRDPSAIGLYAEGLGAMVAARAAIERHHDRLRHPNADRRQAAHELGAELLAAAQEIQIRHARLRAHVGLPMDCFDDDRPSPPGADRVMTSVELKN